MNLEQDQEQHCCEILFLLLRNSINVIVFKYKNKPLIYWFISKAYEFVSTNNKKFTEDKPLTDKQITTIVNSRVQNT